MPEASTASQAKAELSNKAFAWGAVAVACAYLFVAWLQYSPAFFGAIHDDTLYFATAKALATGEGNVLPNLPGSPEQTKYPPLYPWLLSLVWTFGPEFPANLDWAWSLNLLFGVGAVFAAIGLLRSLGCGRRLSLFIAALFALNPHTILWSNLLLSDVLFAALTMTAAVVADRAMKLDGHRFWTYWIAAIVLSVLALSTRSLGIAIVGGLVLYALVHRRFIAGAVASLAATPLMFKVLGALGAAREAQPIGQITGFEQNWVYYTDYLAFWKLCVPSLETLWAQLQFIGVELLKHPAVAAFFLPADGFASMPLQACGVAVTAAIMHGIYVLAKRNGLSAIHCIAVCYMPIVLLWNFVLMSRFGLAFLPLFLAGAAVAVAGLVASIKRSFRNGQPLDQRIAASVLGLILVGLIGNGAWRYTVEVPRGYRGRAIQREGALVAKREAYDWLAKQSKGGLVVSYEDGLLYLYSEFQGMRPFSLSTEAFFRQSPTMIDRDIDRFGDTASELQADYWLVASDDFELAYAKPQMVDATAELLEKSSVVFESTDGTVRIHELDGALTSAVR